MRCLGGWGVDPFVKPYMFKLRTKLSITEVRQYRGRISALNLPWLDICSSSPSVVQCTMPALRGSSSIVASFKPKEGLTLALYESELSHRAELPPEPSSPLFVGWDERRIDATQEMNTSKFVGGQLPLVRAVFRVLRGSYMSCPLFSPRSLPLTR